MDSRSKSAFVQILIAKSVIETLLVGALTIGFFLIAFPPSFQGWGEATPHAIAGWVVNQRDRGRPVEVQLFIDDRFEATAFADRARPDVVAAGYAVDQWHGYSFEIPPVGEGPHAARVYAVHSSGVGARKTLQLVGDPIFFDVDVNGEAHWTRLAPK